MASAESRSFWIYKLRKEEFLGGSLPLSLSIGSLVLCITTPKACPNHAVRYTVFEQRSVGIDSFSRNSLCFSPSVDDGELNIYSHKKNIIQRCAQHETAYLNCACWHSVQERGEVSLNWGLVTQNSLKIFSTYDENNRSYDFPLKKGNSRYIAGFRLNHKLLSNQL